MAAHRADPVGDELDALLGQPEIRQRLEESQRRFEAEETRTFPHQEIRRHPGLDEPVSAGPPFSDEG